MARTQSKKGLIVIIVILGIALLVVGLVVVAKNVIQKPATKTTETSETAPKDTSTTETDATDPTETDTTTPAVDPSTLTSIDIEPLGVAVFYTKGVGAFNFEVKKTADKTQYVEFSATDLAGTKCTDDNGLFASIIKNPSSSEVQATISQTVKLGNDTYGLSLAGKGCTSDPELLEQYQTAFTNGFPSLKTL